MICCVVFVAQFIFERGAQLGWPMYTRDTLTSSSADLTALHVSGGFIDERGNAANAHKVGEVVGKALVNANGEQVGERLFVVRDIPLAWGHFSTYTGVLRLEVWRLITFQFLHGSILHLGFNMLGLWSFGRLVEEQLGPKRYLAFYLMCGIAGGLMYLLLNLAGYIVASATGASNVPGLLVQHVSTPLIGASAGVFGVIIACAKIAPDDQVSFFGIIPMPLKQFAYGYVIISLIMLLFGAKNAGGEAAHIGGAVAGFFFIRNSHLLRDFFDVFGRANSRMKAARGPKLKLVGPPDEVQKTKVTASRDKREMPANLRAEMDAALAKQLSSGTQSLTPQELDSLRRATEWLQSNK